MSFNELKRKEIKKYLLRKVYEDDEHLISKVADSFGISMTSVKRYIDSETIDEHIISDNNAKCKYRLINSEHYFEYKINDISDREDELVYDDIFPLLNINSEAEKIWNYVLPEIFNNVIEHSKGKNAKVYVRSNALFASITIVDDGIGVFKSVTDYMHSQGFSGFKMSDAAIELLKGRFTSYPEKHSGEGIYFSIHMLDRFSLVSDGIVMKNGYTEDSSFIKSHLLSYAMKLTQKGTVAIMQLDNDTNRKAIEVFNTYSDVDDGFTKTRISVFEACLDRNPIARSQARRLCHRLNEFKEVILDFDKVEMMAQGFADELFRVFQNENPDVVLTPINMNDETKKMYLFTIHNKVTAIGKKED